MMNTNRFFFLFVFLLLSPVLWSQQLDSIALSQQLLYVGFEQTEGLDPSQIYRLQLKKQLPDDFQNRIVAYPNLQELQLRGLRLKEVPEVVFQLKTLTQLDISNNKIEKLPPQIKNLQLLEVLIINRNDIISLPAEIASLSSLRLLDMWSTLVVNFPPEMAQLQETLKVVDLRVIRMSQDRQAAIRELLPKTQIYFSPYCNCKN